MSFRSPHVEPQPTSQELERLRAIPTRSFPPFGEMLAPATLSDLVVALDTLSVVGAGWRGQASIDWRLDSSLARRIRQGVRGALIDNSVSLENVMHEAEMRLIERARLGGHDRVAGRELSDLELLGLLQHHGAATRLLDCTHNLFVALWFACRERGEEWGFLAAFSLEDAIEIRTRGDLSRPMSAVLDQIGTRHATWQPWSLSPRMPAQQGFFLFSRAVEEPWGSIAFSGEVLGDVGEVPGVYLLVISPTLKRQMNALWQPVFGYSDEALFPDLDGFADAHGWTRDFDMGFFRGADLTRRRDA